MARRERRMFHTREEEAGVHRADAPAEPARGAQAPAPETRHAAVLALPEHAVMHEDGVMPAGDRKVDQRLAGGHPAQHAQDLGASFHLQAVWAIILQP